MKCFLYLIPLLFLLAAPVANAASYKDVQALNGEVERGNIGALRALEAEAGSGDAEAQAKLGMFYLYTPPRLGFQDDGKALEWLTRAAESGHALAAQSVALIFEGGYGVKRDMFKALKWYRTAAELGDVHSQVVMGNNYMTGFILPKSHTLAFDWYKKAAAAKDSGAMLALSKFYRDGIHVDRDIIKASFWCELAVKNFPGETTGRAAFPLLTECGNISADMTKIQKAIVGKRLKGWEEAHFPGPKR